MTDFNTKKSRKPWVRGNISGFFTSLLGAVAGAEKAARNGDGPALLEHLKKAGKWSLDIANKVGIAVAAKAIQAAMGL
ncbi:hypothetical protein [Methylomonas koyamae]|uniref:hypothetical protein n=1 Tax=Methylomonas koyamae TaxID=702114 RepID=UPI001C81E0A8|nr:hypothetical protein [Methylomonas koyamae]